jgi:hypothetical protein
VDITSSNSNSNSLRFLSAKQVSSCKKYKHGGVRIFILATVEVRMDRCKATNYSRSITSDYHVYNLGLDFA